MNSKAIDLEQLDLSIPCLWERDWNAAISNASGIEKNLLIIQNRAANLLNHINDKNVTFARIAWLNLWTKTFATLDGVFCAFPKNSLYVLRMLGRASFEQMLHARSIIEPILKIYGGLETSEEKIIEQNLLKSSGEKTLKRLEAYTAWCIWNDSLFYEQFDNQILDAVWDAKPADQIYRDSKGLEAYEAIYGRLKLVMDERELKNGRMQQQNEGQHRLHRNRTWLNHPDLKSWHEKLAKAKDKWITFFTLVGESKTTVKNSLRDFELSFAYPVYSEGSMAIHGSSIEQFLHLGNESVMPRFIGTDDEVCEKAEEVGIYCNQVIVILDILIKLLWPK